MSAFERVKSLWNEYRSGKITLEEYNRRLNVPAEDRPGVGGKGYPPLVAGRGTATDRVLEMLLDGQWHTASDIERVAQSGKTGGATRAAAKVRYLRQRGYSIQERDARPRREYRLNHIFTN